MRDFFADQDQLAKSYPEMIQYTKRSTVLLINDATISETSNTGFMTEPYDIPSDYHLMDEEAKKAIPNQYSVKQGKASIENPMSNPKSSRSSPFKLLLAKNRKGTNEMQVLTDIKVRYKKVAVLRPPSKKLSSNKTVLHFISSWMTRLQGRLCWPIHVPKEPQKC